MISVMGSKVMSGWERKKQDVFSPGLCPPTQLQTIQQLIRFHDTRDHKPEYSHRLLLLQDADLLDHFGTYDLWITFRYAMEEEMSFRRNCPMAVKSKRRRAANLF